VVEPQGTVSGLLQPENWTSSANEPLAQDQLDQVMLLPASGRAALEPAAGSVTGRTWRVVAGTSMAAMVAPVGPTTFILGIPPWSEQGLLEMSAKMTAPASEEEELPTGSRISEAERSEGEHAATRE
jgi:hypothetical protein